VSSVRGLRRQAAFGATVLMALGWAVVAAPATAPSGNAAGIALARSVKQTYATIPIESYAEHGFIWMAASEGKQSSFTWEFGQGPYRGLYPATEHGEVALRNGNVSWWRDDLNPGRCTAAGLCNQIPVEVVLSSSGLFYAFGDASHHTCYARLRGTAPFVVGKPVWSVYGDFQAPARTGANEILTSTYPWSIRGAQPLMATEVDTLTPANTRLVTSRVTISAQPGHQAAPFTFSTSYSYPAAAAAQPAITLCR